MQVIYIIQRIRVVCVCCGGVMYVSSIIKKERSILTCLMPAVTKTDGYTETYIH